MTTSVEATAAAGRRSVFEVQLINFSGPFDLLLSLVSRRELDITEIALAQVTDDFIAHIRRIQAAEGEWELDQASEFLVVAATLLDLKAARLLPAGDVEDEADVALLEARDLLFARLLQYRAFKQMAHELAYRLDEEGARYPRDVALEPELTQLLPELVWKHSPEEFAALALKVLTPRREQPTTVGTGHLHSIPEGLPDQSLVLRELLSAAGALSFRRLTEDAESRLVLVMRFLALLELFRDGDVCFEQEAPLSELLVRWSGKEDAGTRVSVPSTPASAAGASGGTGTADPTTQADAGA